MSKTIIFQVALELWGAIFCVICAFVVLFGRKTSARSSQLLATMLGVNSFLLLADLTSFYLQGDTSKSGYYIAQISYFLIYFLEFILLLVLASYFYQVLIENGAANNKKILYINAISVALGLVLLLSNLFVNSVYDVDSTNHYVRYWGAYVSFLLGLICMTTCAFFILKEYKKLPRTVLYASLSFLVIPVLSSIGQIFLYSISTLNIGITISLLFIFIVHEHDKNQKMLQQKMELAEAKMSLAAHEKQLTDDRTKLLLSQIQPHFLYNSLGAIRRLIETDTEDAVESMDHFIGFLRGSVDMLNVSGLVHAKNELEFVQSYLYLEKKRFGKKLTIEYHINDIDFMLPPLTIQPLVENSVRHGIRKKETGEGTVSLHIFSDDSNHRIEIIDDGIGFTIDENVDKVSHVGIKNVKERIEKMCSGTVEFFGKPGMGTKVVIIIPKKKKVTE